jgi:hypothetical protein
MLVTHFYYSTQINSLVNVYHEAYPITVLYLNSIKIIGSYYIY